MQNEILKSNHDKYKNKTIVNFDPIEEFDDIQFKPLTKGLGFSEKKQDEITKDHKIKNSFEAKFKLNTDSNNIEKNQIKLDRLNNPIFDQLNYEKKLNNNDDVQNVLNTNLNENPNILTIEPSSFEKVFSWMIDVVLIATFSVLGLWLSLLLSGFRFEEIKNIVKTVEFSALFSFMSIIYYIFYFTILEKTNHSTFGKRIFKLKIVSNENETLTLYHTFLRSFVFCLAPLSLGLLWIIDAHSKISNTSTKKIREKHV